VATFRDLEPLSYFGPDYCDILRAVGWLGRDQPFETGHVPPEFCDRLVALLNTAYQPIFTRGYHECELCQSDGPKGIANLFVPGDGVLMVCPELIVHYIKAHNYRPPEVFQMAVMACPDTGSVEYRRAYFANGGRRLRGW
jgi:hypothetical protein